MTAPWVLGVDFGTSYTLVAVREVGQRPEVVEIEGERRIPSVVMVDEHGTIVVGRDAEALAATAADSVVRALKTNLGASAPIVLRGRSYQTSALVAAVLRRAYDEAVRYHESAPASVRLTHPAMWTAHQRRQLEAAAAVAGLSDVQFVPEPVAAALA